MGNAATVARNATWLTLQPLVIGIISVMVTAVVARSLGTANYGLLILLLSYAALFSPISNLGLRPYSVREIAADRGRTLEIVADMLVLRFGLALIASIVATAYLTVSDQHIPSILVFVLFIQLVLNALAGCFIDGLYGVESMKSVATVMGATGLIVQMACLGAVLLQTGLAGVAWAYTLGSAASFVISWMTFRKQVGSLTLRFPNKEQLAHVKNSGAFFVQTLISTIRQRIDVVLITSILGPHAAGIYGSSMTLIHRVDLIQDGVSTALFPRVADLHEKSPEELKKLVRGVLKVALVISTPMAVGLVGVSEAVVNLIFGSQFRDSALVLAILGVGTPFVFVCSVFFNVLTAMRMQRVVLQVSVVATALSVGYLVVGINLGGVNGAAVAYLLGLVTSTIALTYLYWRTLGAPIALYDVFGIAAANVAMGIGLWLMKDLGLAPKILISAIIFGGMILLLRIVPLEMIKSPFRRI